LWGASPTSRPRPSSWPPAKAAPRRLFPSPAPPQRPTGHAWVRRTHSGTVPTSSSPGNGRAPRPPPGHNGGRWCACHPPPLRPSACPSTLYKKRAPPPIPPAPLPPLYSPARATRSFAGARALPTAPRRRSPLGWFLLLSKLPGELLLLSSSFWFFSHLISCMGVLFRCRRRALRRTRGQRRREPPISGEPPPLFCCLPFDHRSAAQIHHNLQSTQVIPVNLGSFSKETPSFYISSRSSHLWKPLHLSPGFYG
jgi:hypothetical protein